MTSKEALEKLKRLELFDGGLECYTDLYTLRTELFKEIEKDLKALENIKIRTRLLYSERKVISKEFDRWCEENGVANCSESMATWFLSIKLKEWMENGR